MPHSQREKAWLIGGGLVAGIMVLIGYLMFISPQKSQTSSVQAQIAAAQQRNVAAAARIQALQKENANLARYQADFAQAKLALPDTSGLPDFLRTLQSLGNATQSKVVSLNVGAPTDVALSRTGTTVTPAGAAAGSSQTATAARKTYALAITASISGSTDHLGEFLKQLQSVQSRAVLITGITQSVAAGSAASTGSPSGDTTITLTMTAFVSPASAAEQAQLAAASARK